ncbi:MAG: hypothetical protein IT382_17315 [Deltaproteobacteria bacterium]|nr:hypothetical protein [Deltaproteobacteria bacterium]
MRSVAGVDAGMSFTDATTGVCRTAPWLLTTAWADRASRLAALALPTGPPGLTLEVVAIDAPLLPGLAWSTITRAVEVAFQRGAFQKRGKPGLSHIPGTGQGLRRAGHDTAHHLRSQVAVGASSVFPRVAPENLVEAFPNAYLAVLLGDADHRTGALRRGERFDVLFDRAVGVLDKIAAALGGAGVFPAFSAIKDHDERAAAVCALTALGVAENRYSAVGDAVGGWFFLPAWQWWQPWGKGAIGANRVAAGVDVWLDGVRHPPSAPLPP